MDKGFIAGLGYALAWLHKWHDVGTPIEELYRQSGFSLEDFERECEEYDLVELRKLAAAAGNK
jgi:hypothetical protein